MPVLFTRRRALAGIAGVSALWSKAPYRPRLAVQCYVWTQQFSAEKRSLADGAEEMFAATSRAGYRRMELINSFFTPELAEKTIDLAKKYRLEIPIVYAGGVMHEPAAAEKTIAEVVALTERLRPLSTRIIVTNPSPKPRRERKSDEELALQARHVNQLAGTLGRRGMRLILHHHDPEMAENAREWRHLLTNTDTSVGICMDIDWVIRGGQQPALLLREAGERLVDLHLRNAHGGVWTESLAEGDYDYPAIAAELHDLGFQGYLTVELAHEKGTRITRSLEEDLKLSRAYAQKIFHPL